MGAGTIGDRRGGGRRLGPGWGGTWGTREWMSWGRFGDKKKGAKLLPAGLWKDGGASSRDGEGGGQDRGAPKVTVKIGGATW